MSRLVADALRYASMSGTFKPDDAQMPAYREGKQFAADLVAEMRRAGAHPRLMFVGVGMAAMSRDKAFSEAFNAEIQRQLASSVEAGHG